MLLFGSGSLVIGIGFGWDVLEERLDLPIILCRLELLELVTG